MNSPLPATSARTKRTLLLIVLVGIAPIVASYVAYYLWQRDAKVNYGKLVVQAAPALTGTALDGARFDLEQLRGRWVVLWQAPGACTGGCASALYATRQARTMQNTEEDRVVRVWVVTGDASPDPAVLRDHPGLLVVREPGDPLDRWPQGRDAIYAVDPRGNLVLAWPLEPDIKALAKDLSRLLRASRIG
jgi:hypothetical protein